MDQPFQSIGICHMFLCFFPSNSIRESYISQLRLTGIRNLNCQFPKMLLIPHVLIRLLRLLEPKHLLIHNGLDTTRIYRLIHLLELLSGPHHQPSNGTDITQTIQESRLVLGHAAQESDDGDDAFGFDGLERLGHRLRASDLEDVGAADAARGELLGSFAPIGVGFVVEDVVCA